LLIIEAGFLKIYIVQVRVINMMRRGEQGGGTSRRTGEKCGICGKNVPEQPTVTDEGTCNQCGARLSMTMEER
jgi:DNA-directed RNA polymerase subunit RPC12/RpoP